MKAIESKPDVQIWVCVNERASSESLPSCTLKKGNEIYRHLSSEVQKISAFLGKNIWVNRTYCQGFCSASGVTVTVEPLGLKWQAVTVSDLQNLVAVVVERMK